MQSVLIEDSEWRDDFGKKLFNLQQSGQFCDVIIKTVEDARLLVHSCVLAAASPLLKGVIESALSDATLGTIMLSSDIDVNTWTHMLEFMYTGCATVPDDLVASLQSGATILKVDTLVNRCNEILQTLTKIEEEAVPVEATDIYSAIAQIKEDTEPIIEDHDGIVTVIQGDMQVEGTIVTQQGLPEGTIVTQQGLPEGTIITQQGLPEGTIVTQADIDETPADLEQAQADFDEAHTDLDDEQDGLDEATDNDMNETQEGIDATQVAITEEQGIEGQEAIAAVQDEMDTQDYIDDVHDAPTAGDSIVITTSIPVPSDTEDITQDGTEIVYQTEEQVIFQVQEQDTEINTMVEQDPNTIQEVTLQIKVDDSITGTEIYDSTQHIVDENSMVVPKMETLIGDDTRVVQVTDHNQVVQEIPVYDTQSQNYFTVEQSEISGVINENSQIQMRHNIVQGEPEFDVVGYSKKGGKEFKCRLCGKICKNPWDHKRVHSAARPYTCEFEGCGRMYKCKSNMLQHMESHRFEEATYPCRKCGKKFKTKYLLMKHESITCNDNCTLYSCNICGKNFKSLKNLNYHEATHSTYKPIKCPICSKGFATQDHLKVHMPLHDVGDFNCHCGKQFKTEKLYKIHYRLQHSTDALHRCEQCGKNFVSALVLEKHKKTHNKPYACRYCNRGFINASGCYNHERKWHKEKFGDEDLDETSENQQFQCPQCEELFKTKATMFRHLDSHFYDRNRHECHICMKRYESKSRLETHLSVHADYTIPCEECGKKFKTNAHLREHMLSHNKPFVCIICDARFSLKKYLLKHEENHKQGKDVNRYKCQDDFCNEAFPTREQVQNHMKENHPDVPYVIGKGGSFTNKEKKKKTKVLKEVDEVPIIECEDDIVSTVEKAFYNCEICCAKFQMEKSLTRHELQKHDKGERWTCSECGVKFITPRTLKIHQFHDHNIGESLSCEKCPRIFFTEDDLCHHIDIVHLGLNVKKINKKDSQPLHICFVCTRYLPTAVELSEHEDEHTLQELVCRLCKRSCRTVSSLKKHMQKCSDKQCMFCCQEFPTNEELIKHMKVHQMGKIVYKCSTCAKEFNRIEQLKMHSLSHEVEAKAEESEYTEIEFTEENVPHTPIAKQLLESFAKPAPSESDVSNITLSPVRRSSRTPQGSYKSLLSAI